MQGQRVSMEGYHRRGVPSEKLVGGGDRYASRRSPASLLSVVEERVARVAGCVQALVHLRVFVHPPSRRDPSQEWDRRGSE